MKTPHKSDSDSGAGSSAARGRQKNQSSRHSKGKEIATEASRRPNAKISDLPPNENIHKRADEVYGDTEIPERKPGT